jgi:putative transposase
MPWQNFSIWRARLPHWRADDVTYYVTFRHRRPLDDFERRAVLRALLKPDGRRWDLMILCVLPEVTDLILTVRDAPTGEAYELSDVVEKAKTKAGKEIIKKTGERFPPFYGESYDRILRDDEEIETFWQNIFDGPVKQELVEDSEAYDALWVANAPE